MFQIANTRDYLMFQEILPKYSLENCVTYKYEINLP